MNFWVISHEEKKKESIEKNGGVVEEGVVDCK